MSYDSTIGRMVFVILLPFLLFTACRSPGDYTPMHPRKQDPGLSDGEMQAIEDAFAHQRDQDPPEEDEPYVTGVYAYAGCTSDGTHVAVAAHHVVPGECEKIVLTSYYAHDGEMEEWSVPFAWATTDANLLETSCLNGPNDNFCWPIGLQDAFDTVDSLPPSADLIACALNTCPEPRPADCLDMLCMGFTVEVAVNVEGAWSLSGATFVAGDTINLAQDGDTFEDTTDGLKRGTVNGTVVNFEIGDYAYSGIILSDHSTMQGLVSSLMTDEPIGSWTAVRASSP